MKRFQDGWYFRLFPLHTPLQEAASKMNEYEAVEIPHDWLIDNLEKSKGEIKETGWYRKVFDMGEKRGQTIIRFDGVYMDCTIYLNRKKVSEWKNGYTCFEVDLTPYIKDGENEIFLSVNHETPNSRWYSGAGIYRSVWLIERDDPYINTDGVYIVTEQLKHGYQVSIQTEYSSEKSVEIRHRIRDRTTGSIIGETIKKQIPGNGELLQTEDVIIVKEPKLWDIEHPFLYEVVTELFKGVQTVDTQVNRFGFKTIHFDPELGFLMNGKKVKLQGVCEHHDLGCLGAAFNRCAMKRRMLLLKEMGVNAIRISHNMPAYEVMELADEMGFFIVSELYDMWERPKNSKDFARFFKEWYQKDTAYWIRRDRNCPSIIMWSIGNEIYDTHANERGQEITRQLMEEVLKHDPMENAKVTLASNYMPWENARTCADIVKIAGYNYSEKYYAQHHTMHPDWVIYGSETGSIVQSRGIYHFPLHRQILTDDDLQCSSLGNSITSWGAKSVYDCILAEREHPFSCGQFIWTGFDYIGEPTPYHTKNSYFGQLDTAGFQKDSYYLYQAAWTDYKITPMVHIYPYWDFNEGQLIDVLICSNAPVVELIVNGMSHGKQQLITTAESKLFAVWQVPYEKGYLKAIAYDWDASQVAQEQRNSFQDANEIILTPDKTTLAADGTDLIFVTVTMVDCEGKTVENANNRVDVNVSKAGRLIGLDNGDSSDWDSYKGVSRRLFSGKLLIVIGAGDRTGEIKVKVTSKGLKEKELTLYAGSCEAMALSQNKSVPVKNENLIEDDIPVRKIELCSEGRNLHADFKKTKLTAILHPPDTTYKEVEWSVTDDGGIPSHIADIKGEGLHAWLYGIGDGTCRVRCTARNGTDHPCIISQLEFELSGFGKKALNPYEFVSGGLYHYSKGEAGNGNERGVSTARDGETQIGYENLDFGSFGADEITMYIFALTDEEYPIQIWEGIPGGEESELLSEVVYQKPSIWNVYQEETFQLSKRLTGTKTVCFLLRQKIHLKGFSFRPAKKGLMQLWAGEANRIYGDHFERKERVVHEIGNNVSLEFYQMDFGEEGVDKLTICGNSMIECNSIHIRFKKDGEELKQLVEFLKTEKEQERSFSLERVTGIWDVTFLFLPGSRFDFNWFQFK